MRSGLCFRLGTSLFLPGIITLCIPVSQLSAQGLPVEARHEAGSGGEGGGQNSNQVGEIEVASSIEEFAECYIWWILAVALFRTVATFLFSAGTRLAGSQIATRVVALAWRAESYATQMELASGVGYTTTAVAAEGAAIAAEIAEILATPGLSALAKRDLEQGSWWLGEQLTNVLAGLCSDDASQY